MKTLDYLLDMPAGKFREKYSSDPEDRSGGSSSLKYCQEFSFVDISLSHLGSFRANIDVLSVSCGFVDVIRTEMRRYFIDEGDSDEFDFICQFEGFLTEQFSEFLILRLDSDIMEQCPLGDGWPLFPHSVERFYQWLFQLDSARWAILNAKPRRSEGALEAMEALLRAPILVQRAVPPREAFAFASWPEVKGDSANEAESALVIDETLIQSYLGGRLLDSVDADLFRIFIDLANTGRRLLQAGATKVKIACKPESIDAVLTIRRNQEADHQEEIFQCATIKTNYVHHLLRIMDQGTWQNANLVIDLAQYAIEYRVFMAALTRFYHEVIPERIRSNSLKPHCGKIVALFLKEQKLQMATFQYEGKYADGWLCARSYWV